MAKACACQLPLNGTQDNSNVVNASPNIDKPPLTGARNKSDAVNKKELFSIPLIPVNASFGIVTSKPENTVDLHTMLENERKNKGGDVTVLFAIRSVGCGGCREHGEQLVDLVKSDKNINLVATVKETGLDDQALLDFYEKHFPYPFYKDEKWRIYKAMGGRKVRVWSILRRVVSMTKRTKQKNIDSIGIAVKGDFWTKGGVMVFDKRGKLCLTHHESFGVEFDMDAIKAAIAEARLGSKVGK